MTNALENRFAANALSTEQSASVQGGITFVMTTQGCVVLRPKPIKQPYPFGYGFCPVGSVRKWW